MAQNRLTFLLISAVALLPFAAHAELGASASIDAVIDEARTVRLDTAAAQIIVGNPAIADVTPVNGHVLVVTGKSYGTTNLIVLDAGGREIFNAQLNVASGKTQVLRVFKGTAQMSLHCAPECQRTLTIGDDKTQFDPLAEIVTKKFGVVNSAVGNGGGN